MPLEEFICPDGVSINTKDCLDRCRMGDRCLTRTTLRVIVDGERVWDGVPHVTNMLNGVRHEVLKATTPYFTDPRSRAYALLGSSHHALHDLGGIYSEIALEMRDDDGAWLRGTADLLEYGCTKYVYGEWSLVDYKTWGSYRVRRALGLEKVSFGGRMSLSDKDSWRWEANPDKADVMSEALQLNMYRIMLEKDGWDVDRMKLQVTVRDGGMAAARTNGVDQPMYMIPVPKLEDKEVLAYFHRKAGAVLEGINGGEVIDCTEDETWQGTRCKKFCEVVGFCTQRDRWRGMRWSQ